MLVSHLSPVWAASRTDTHLCNIDLYAEKIALRL